MTEATAGQGRVPGPVPSERGPAAADRDGDLTDELAADVATDLLTTLTSFGTWADLTGYHGRDRADYVHHLRWVIERTLVLPTG